LAQQAQPVLVQRPQQQWVATAATAVIPLLVRCFGPEVVVVAREANSRLRATGAAVLALLERAQAEAAEPLVEPLVASLVAMARMVIRISPISSEEQVGEVIRAAIPMLAATLFMGRPEVVPEVGFRLRLLLFLAPVAATVV
jgi:hypothetical protein